MSPMSCIEHLKSVEETLEAEEFKELAEQIHNVSDDVVSVMDTRDIEHLSTVSAAHAAAIYLRQLQHS